MSRRGVGALAASPTLVGAITTLIVILAVFLAYNANNGLPFVPSYRHLGRGAERGHAGSRQRRADRRRPGGLRRVGRAGPGPADRRRPREGRPEARQERRSAAQGLDRDRALASSALGLKYLEIDKGTSKQGLSGGRGPAAQGRSPEAGRDRPGPEHVRRADADGDPSRTWSRSATRWRAAGPDLNAALGELRPLARPPRAGGAEPRLPKTGLDRFFRALADTAAEVAPVAEVQAQMFVSLDTTFGAFAGWRARSSSRRSPRPRPRSTP